MAVVRLDQWKQENSPHTTGEAVCIACKHEWVSVCPVGHVWLECPSCGTSMGHMKFHVERGDTFWECNCGNNLFMRSPDGMYCVQCGEWQVGED